MNPTLAPTPLLRLLVTLFALWLMLPGQARADTCTATMTDVAFGNVNPIDGTDYYAGGTLTVTCTWTLLTGTPPLLLLPNVSVCATLGGGSGMWRTMTNGADTLPFNLYTDTTYAAASVWSTGTTSGTASFNVSMGGLLAIGSLSRSFPVYGKIPGSAITAVRTVGNGNTTYTANFSGQGTLQFAFYGLVKPACTSGASTTFAFQARATVVNDCRISAAPLAFGTARVLNAPVRASAALGIQCTAGTAYQVSLNSGNYAIGGQRRMRNGATGEMVYYGLSATYDGPAWGDGANGTTLGGTGTGAVQSQSLYGRVAPQATPSPGDYKDTVTATLIF